MQLPVIFRPHSVCVLLLLPVLVAVAGCQTQGTKSIGFDLSSDGRFMVFEASGKGGSGVFRLSFSKLRVSTVVDTAAFEFSPAINTRGEVVYSSWLGQRSANLFVIGSDGVTMQLTREGTHNVEADFIPRKNEVVFAGARTFRSKSTGGKIWDDWGIKSVDMEVPGHVVSITRRDYRGVSRPVCSPDGRMMIFAANTLGGQPPGTNLYLLGRTATGYSQAKLLSSGMHPVFSPDGKRIAFIDDESTPFEYEVWEMDANGTNRRQITRSGSYNMWPCYHRDGKTILFLQYPERRGYPDLWEVETATGKSRMLFDRKLFEDPLRWKPPV